MFFLVYIKKQNYDLNYMKKERKRNLIADKRKRFRLEKKNTKLL